MATPSRLETITSPDPGFPGGVGRFRDVQVANRVQWQVIPDDQTMLASLHTVNVQPAGATTITRVNPLDPGSTIDSGGGVENEPRWLVRPGHNGRLFPVQR